MCRTVGQVLTHKVWAGSVWQHQKFLLVLSHTHPTARVPSPSGRWGAGWGDQKATPHSPVKDHRLLHRVSQELLDVVPLQEGWGWQGISRDPTPLWPTADPKDAGTRLLVGSWPPHVQTVSGGKNRSSPCCRLCMFLSDPLCFLKREHSMVGSWPGLDSVPHLLR